MNVNKSSLRMALLVALVLVLALLLMLSGCSRPSSKERYLLMTHGIDAKEAPCESATSPPPSRRSA